MRVNGRGETVVVEVAVHARAEIDGLHHAASGQDAQQRVEVRKAVHVGCFQRVGQRLGRIRTEQHILSHQNGMFMFAEETLQT